MAITAYNNWRARNDGNQLNGCGFDPSLTTNMLADGAATSANTASPVFSSASYAFVTGDVGAAVYVASGTNWVAGWYPIVSVNAGAATLGAAVSTIYDSAITADNYNLTTAGCASVASPTGAKWSIDYSWQAAAILSLSDLTSTASTTVTSATGGFGKNMIGNIWRMASGTGATTGYYALVNVTNTNTVTFDRVSGTYTAGVGKLGGAAPGLINFATAGTVLPTPTIASPVVAGNMVWMRGAGSDAPSADDWDYSAGYYTLKSAASDQEPFCKLFGYNGRVQIGHSCPALSLNGWHVSNIKAVARAITLNASYGFVYSSGVTKISNAVIDTAGFDHQALHQFAEISYVIITNSGVTTAGTKQAIEASPHKDTIIANCYIENQRGGFLNSNSNTSVMAENVIVSGSKGTAEVVLSNSYVNALLLKNCTFVNGAGDFVAPGGTRASKTIMVERCIITGYVGVGKYVFKFSGSTVYNDRLVAGHIKNNLLYNNTANYLNLSAGVGDVYANPAFANSGTLDFGVGANAKGAGNVIYGTATTNYVDFGAAQRKEPVPGPIAIGYSS